MSKLSRKETRAAVGFLLPAYSIFLLFLAIPLFAALAMSFMDVDRFAQSFTFVGFDNFNWIFTDTRFWTTFNNTLLFVFLAVVGKIVLGLGLAVLLDRSMPTFLLYFLRLAYFMPVLVSIAFVSFIWKFLFSFDLGVINYYLRDFGLPPVQWLTNGKVALISVVIVDIWKNLGFYLIILLAALQGVPRNLLEAAYIDGASKATILFRIKIPAIAPVILFCVTFATIDGLQVFDAIRILTNGGPGDSTRSVVMYMYGEAFGAGELGTGAAAAVTLFLLIIFVISAQMIIRGTWRKWS